MGAVDTTYTFTATDTITSTKMNNIIDQTTITTDAIIGNTLEVTSGKLKVRAQGITSNEMATGSVTSNAIANGNVTPEKLGGGYPPQWSSNLSNFNIQHNALELSTGITTNSASFIDFHSVFPLTDYECRLIRDTGPNGWFGIYNNGNGSIQFKSNGGLYIQDSPMPNPVGNAPLYPIRAWVNFNGTSGSTAIRQQGNVSSVSRTGTGLYTVNLTTPVNDTDYAIVGFARDAGTTPGNYFVSAVSNGTKTTSSFQIRVHSTGGLVDSPEINLMVIR